MSHWWLLASSISPPPPSGKLVRAEELLDGFCSLWFVQEQVEAVRAPSCKSFYGEGEVKTDQSESEEGRVALREKAVTQGVPRASVGNLRAVCLSGLLELWNAARRALPSAGTVAVPSAGIVSVPSAGSATTLLPAVSPGWAEVLRILYRRERRSLSIT